MCYSFQTSIISFSIGMIAGIVAVCTNQIIIGTLILFFVQMQLAEALIWRGIDTNNKNLNKIGTLYAKYNLPTHLFAIGLGYLISIFYQKEKFLWTDIIPLLIGIIFYLSVVLLYYRTKSKTMTFPLKITKNKCQNPDNRLLWPFPHYKWYVVSFILSIIVISFLRTLKLYSKILFIFFILTIYFISLFLSRQTIGSFFCFFSAIGSPIIVFLNYFIVHDNFPNLKK